MLHTSLLAPPSDNELLYYGMPEELHDLKGVHPRSEGHICTSIPTHEWVGRVPSGYQPCICRRKTEAWRQGPSSVTLTEWRLFRRTGHIGRQFWVIQGTNGGHRRWISHEEGLLLEAEGYPPHTPDPGELAYAPFDERVVNAITRFNRLWAFRNRVEEYKETMGDGYATYRKSVQKELRKQLVAHLKEEMRDVEPLFVAAADEGEIPIGTHDIDYDRLAPQNEEHFIETGQILHHTRAS
jgi:hypothetical protein